MRYNLRCVTPELYSNCGGHSTEIAVYTIGFHVYYRHMRHGYRGRSQKESGAHDSVTKGGSECNHAP